MNIFNSLGSNYSYGFALKTLFQTGDKRAELVSYLEEKYQGKAVLLYKGREAIELALSLLKLPKGSKVAVNGFTCFAVSKAIEDAGCSAVYLDIAQDSLNFSPKELEKSLKQNPLIKVVIIQNTLGYPAKTAEIAKICQANKIILIEDLAHSVRAIYSDGTEAGRLGDFVILSFSQDKIIDAVSGGALIVRNSKFKTSAIKLGELPISQQLVDRFYPLFTWKIRALYPFFLGKLTHFILKKAHLLSQPMAGSKEATSLPGWYAGLVKYRFDTLDENLTHRQEIAQIYAKSLNKKVLIESVDEIKNSTNLRFPILVKDRAGLINELKKSGIHISDTWYDAPIGPKKYLKLSDYQSGSCPESEKVSQGIVNLPTHRSISAVDAINLSGIVNQWLKSN